MVKEIVSSTPLWGAMSHAAQHRDTSPFFAVLYACSAQPLVGFELRTTALQGARSTVGCQHMTFLDRI